MMKVCKKCNPLFVPLRYVPIRVYPRGRVGCPFSHWSSSLFSTLTDSPMFFSPICPSPDVCPSSQLVSSRFFFPFYQLSPSSVSYEINKYKRKKFLMLILSNLEHNQTLCHVNKVLFVFAFSMTLLERGKMKKRQRVMRFQKIPPCHTYFIFVTISDHITGLT